ncbi:hypothetical protein PVAP13_3KG511101 [Panicum virgatum]|uniref:Uncharacterized protein n=1 Tax=Panicum virgatum TaxID=38727 RepID=A0A8T0V6A2_PANVG|nr:hypothetical protein PVAP13_3KG511101 [Panicum virgatum]
MTSFASRPQLAIAPAPRAPSLPRVAPATELPSGAHLPALLSRRRRARSQRRAAWPPSSPPVFPSQPSSPIGGARVKGGAGSAAKAAAELPSGASLPPAEAAGSAAKAATELPPTAGLVSRQRRSHTAWEAPAPAPPRPSVELAPAATAMDGSTRRGADDFVGPTHQFVGERGEERELNMKRERYRENSN